MKIIATNRRARFDYDLSENLVAGIVLSGAEVKSVKQGHISLKGSYVTVTKGELYLINAHISPYKYADRTDFDEKRDRKLLIHKSELSRLTGLKQSGVHMVPTAVGLSHGLIKIEVGLGRGRARGDKRERVKKREADRDIARVKKAKSS